VTEFPELQQALVHAAGRRRRATRLARPLVVAVACAAIVAAALVIARQPSDERTATPPVPPTASYAVFQRAATNADEPPSAVTSMPGLRIDEARLAQRIGPWRLYLVAGTLDQREVLCAFVVIHERSRYGCDPAGTVHGYGFPPGDGDPGVIAATLPDGIDQVDFQYGSERLGVGVTDNAALLLPDPWPAGRGTIVWSGGAVPMKSPLP
jgi:hypothetical protein